MPATRSATRFATHPLPPVLSSEWTKLHSLPALRAALLALLLGSTTVSLLACGLYDGPDAAGEDFEPVSYSFYGLPFGQLAAVCFGVLAVTSEYGHGGIRLSLAAVPRRGLLLCGKLAVVGGLALSAGLLTGLVALTGGQALLGDYGTDLAAPGALRAALGCGLYVMLLTLLAAGVATLLRGPVAALGVLVPLMFLLAPVLGTENQVVQFLPGQAGAQILHPEPDGTLGAWSGLAVLAGWTVLAVGAGWRALERRDA